MGDPEGFWQALEDPEALEGSGSTSGRFGAVAHGCSEKLWEALGDTLLETLGGSEKLWDAPGRPARTLGIENVFVFIPILCFFIIIAAVLCFSIIIFIFFIIIHFCFIIIIFVLC